MRDFSLADLNAINTTNQAIIHKILPQNSTEQGGVKTPHPKRLSYTYNSNSALFTIGVNFTAMPKIQKSANLSV
jgi:hypothetical protein